MFAIFDKLGGLDAALDVLERRRGLRPQINAIRAWRRNKALPAINVLYLMQEAEERGIAVEVSDFAIPQPKKPRRRKARAA